MRRRLNTLASQGAWAIIDQALFAGSNLIVNVLLARWLPGEEYGAFVTAYTVLLLVQIAHAALLIEPMLIFGADKHQACFSEYFSLLRRYHWRLMTAVSIVMGLAAAVVAFTVDTRLGEALAGLAVTAPLILMNWLARRGCYGVSNPRLAAAGGAVNLTVVIAGLFGLTRIDYLTVTSAQLLLGAASLATTACLVPVLNRATTLSLGESARRGVWIEHCEYARWSAATGVCTWFHTFLYYLVLPGWSGLAASGQLKALLNLITPIQHSDGALVTMLLPQFVRSRRVPEQFVRVVRLTVAVFAIEALLYWALLSVAGQRIALWLYGGAFQFDRSALLLLGAIPLLTTLVNILGNALRARNQPDGVFWATVGAGVAGGTVGVGAVAIAGLDGAMFGMVVASAVQVAVMLWLLWQPTSEAILVTSPAVGDAAA